MNAPIAWIAAPFLAAIILLFIPSEKWISYIGGTFSLVLAILAYILPPNTAIRLGTISLRMDPGYGIIGRTISLGNSDQVILILVYGIGAFWFFGTLASGYSRRIIPMGLAIIALLVTSLVIQPFLYAALIIELSILVSVPMLAEPAKKPGRGLLRYLIYQTFAMPFILFAGFLLSGVESGPTDLAIISQAVIMLGFGFAFLLSIFPLFTWIPMLADETLPFAIGFILIIFPTFTQIFGLTFIDRYVWLRDSQAFSTFLQVLGLIMVISAGLLAAFQHQLNRIFAYTTVAETGLTLLAISLPDREIGLQIAFFLIIPRALAYGIWTLSINVFRRHIPADLQFSNIKGFARQFPFASAGIILANLSLAGTPMLASFPVRQALWENLAAQSQSGALWFGFASLGLWTAAIRTLAVLNMAPENTSWETKESPAEKILIGAGIVTLLLLGLYPQWSQSFLANLPSMFEHLGK